jgi:hypothetical protein
MTALFLYAAVLFMAGSVLVNRIGQRRMAAARKSLAGEENALVSLEREIVEHAQRLNQIKEREAALDDQLHGARLAVEHLTEKFDEARAAPLERYHIFDRLDARPGSIWSLEVRRADDASNARMAAAWPTPRTYLIVASTPREAVDRALQRFPRNQGFEVGNAAPCHLFKSKRSSATEAGDA